MLSPEQMRERIFSKSCLPKDETERIYNEWFERWIRENEPLYIKFGITTNEKILDCGASYGYNLIHFETDSLALESNPNIVKFLHSIDLEAKQVNIEEDWGFPDEKFEIIWATDILVHLTAPYLFLLRCREHMDKDSKLIIQVPRYTKSPTHYYIFNLETLKYLVEAAGFEIIKTSGHIRKAPTFINAIIDSNEFTKSLSTNIWVMAKKGKLEFSPKQPRPIIK